jgi:DNA-binding beta-propeller fold protein YncE
MKSVRGVLAAGLISGLLFGGSDLVLAANANFKVTDAPGSWFDTGNTIAGTRSLAIVKPGDTVFFTQTVESLHTVTSLIWPTGAGADELIDQDAANKDDHQVTLKTPGLYVFVCKLHPYMLGGVIVDSDATPGGLDIGDHITLAGVGSFPSNSNLGLRLLRAFFVVTSPSNWKDYTKVGQPYKPVYPAVPVVVTGGAIVPDLNAALQATFDGDIIPAQQKPKIKGVGEVWVDTQYELTHSKGEPYPGTISVVEVNSLFPALNWRVKRKIGLPAQKMNNGHNMWASHNQQQIYQTEWHGKSLYVIDRLTGKLLKEIEIGEDPAHVMTRVDTGQVHVTLNGEDSVVELDPKHAPKYLEINRNISMQDRLFPTKPTQPHAHWMGFDGKTMATPNANSNDSTLYDFVQDEVVSKLGVGVLPIAVGMMPDSSKYYVSNYLGHSLTVIDMKTQTVKSTINLLEGYNPVTGLCAGVACVNIGGLPIQTPVSPDGKFVITGNTLTGTITIVDAKTDKVVKTITCDPGCHGVNFGAKKGGGYYAYVTSKFANRLIVLDYDPNRDGNASDAVIAGWVVLANDNVPKDDAITGNRGQGGQGVLPVPNVYNGWVQKLPAIWKIQLTKEQRHPFPQTENGNAHDDE